MISSVHEWYDIKRLWTLGLSRRHKNRGIEKELWTAQVLVSAKGQSRLTFEQTGHEKTTVGLDYGNSREKRNDTYM